MNVAIFVVVYILSVIIASVVIKRSQKLDPLENFDDRITLSFVSLLWPLFICAWVVILFFLFGKTLAIIENFIETKVLRMKNKKGE